MSESVNLGLPYLAAAQAQKHVTVNEALRILDAVAQISVISRALTAPPGSPSDGDRYLVAGGATGAWAGWDGDVAAWLDGAWFRLSLRPGWFLWDEGTGKPFVSTGSGLVELATV